MAEEIIGMHLHNLLIAANVPRSKGICILSKTLKLSKMSGIG